jgi:hypothetical protein
LIPAEFVRGPIDEPSSAGQVIGEYRPRVGCVAAPAELGQRLAFGCARDEIDGFVHYQHAIERRSRSVGDQGVGAAPHLAQVARQSDEGSRANRWGG